MKIVPDTRAVPLNSYHAPAANTAAVVTVAASTDDAWVIYEIVVSLSANFAAATKLNVTFGGVEVFAADLITAGVYALQFRKGLTNNTKNEAAVVTLAADTGGASGSVNVVYA